MANVRGIKRRLVSVTNTKKITYAMKLVSAAKLRTAQAAVTSAKEYAAGLTSLAKDVFADIDLTELSHPLTEKRHSISKVAVLVIGGSRGLCGGYNSNVNKRLVQFEKELLADSPSLAIEYIVIGKKPAEFLRRTKRKVTVPFEALSEDPNKWPLEELCQGLKDRFIKQDFDQLFIGYTKFRSALSQTAVVEQALPYSNSEVASSSNGARVLTTFEPSPRELFNALIPRLFMAQVLAASLEAKTGEHASRMVAMDGATKNCGELIDTLRITINKLRQAQITSQLLDIIGGAEAVQ